MDGTGVIAPPPEPIDTVPQEIRYIDASGEYVQAGNAEAPAATQPQYEFVIDPAMLQAILQDQGESESETQPTSLEQIAAELNVRQTGLEASIAAAEQEIAALQQELAASQVQLSAWEAPPAALVPHTVLEKPQNAAQATLAYGNVAPGSDVIVMQGFGDSATVLRQDLPETNGSITLQTPAGSDRLGYYVFLESPGGQREYMGGWDTYNGRNYGNMIRTEATLETLAHENPASTAALQEHISLETHCEDLGRQIAFASLHLEELRGELSTVQAEIGHAGALQQMIADTNLQSILETHAEVSQESIPAVDGDTPEARLDAWQAAQEALQTQINTRTGLITDLGTMISREQIRLQGADAMDAEADKTLMLAAEQERMEQELITPEMEVKTYKLKKYFDVRYENMPEGTSLTMNGSRVPDDFRVEIPGGTGTLRVAMPMFGQSGSATIVLVDAEGNTVTNFFTFKHTADAAASSGGAKSDHDNLPSIAYTPEIPEELRVSAEDIVAADATKAEAVSIRADATKRIAVLASLSTTIEREIVELERQKIPYARMLVSAEGNTFNVRYMNPGEQSYFEVKLAGEPGFIFHETREHAEGQADGSISFNIFTRMGDNGNGPVEIFLYADANKSELLDHFNMGSYNRQQGIAEGGSNGAWGELETGRIVENPMTPTIAVLQTSGANLLVAVQSPFDRGVLQLTGGGRFAVEQINCTGGTELSAHLLTFNTSNPAGFYRLTLTEDVNGAVIATETLYWDPATKTLTSESAEKELTLSEGADTEQLASLTRQFNLQTTLRGMSIQIPTLQRVQADHLYDQSRFTINLDEEATYIANSRLAGHPDGGAIFKQLAVEGYGAVVKALLQDAANIAVTAWNGGSQEEANAFYEERYAVLAGNRYVCEFAIDFGVHLPSMEAIREEGIRLAQAMVSDLHTQQAKQVSMYARDTYFASLGGSEEPVGRSQEAINAQLRSIAEAHGTDSEQYRNYIASWQPGTSDGVYVATAGVNDGGVEFGGILDAAEFARQMENLENQGLLKAKNAQDPLERHGILQEMNIMEYIPGDSSHAGKLLIFVNGHLQRLDSNPNEAGMNYLTNEFEKQGYEILHFRVGNAFLPFSMNTQLIYELTEKVVMERLAKQGVFANAVTVASIGGGGFSWGGGTVSKLAHALDASEYTNIPVHVVLIDAVKLGYTSLVQPVSMRPPAESVFNRYQGHNLPILINGQPANGTSFLIVNGLDSQEAIGNNENHLSIDDIDSSDFVNGVRQDHSVIAAAASFLSRHL